MPCPWRSPTCKSRCRAHCLSRLLGKKCETPQVHGERWAEAEERGDGGGRGQNQRAGHSQQCQEPLVSGPVPASGITNKESSRGPGPSQAQSSVMAPSEARSDCECFVLLSKAMILNVGRTRPLTLLGGNGRTTQGGWAKAPVTRALLELSSKHCVLTPSLLKCENH